MIVLSFVGLFDKASSQIFFVSAKICTTSQYYEIWQQLKFESDGLMFTKITS